MANEVCTDLGLIGKDLSGRLLQIIEEHNSNASFMINSLMWNATKSDTSICLLALHYSMTHYQNVTKKLGLNLKAAVENKSAVVLEPFNMLTQEAGMFDDCNMQIDDVLKQLYFTLKDNLKSFSGKKCLIIDDLSDLLCLGSTPAQVIIFLQYCRVLQDTDADLALIVCSHCSEENINQNIVANFIGHVADYTVTIAGLKTGFSANVTGTIEVVDNIENANNFDKKLFHFKLTDRQVKVFAPGTVGFQA